MSKYRINRILEFDKIMCNSLKKIKNKKDFFYFLNDYDFKFYDSINNVDKLAYNIIIEIKILKYI